MGRAIGIAHPSALVGGTALPQLPLLAAEVRGGHRTPFLVPDDWTRIDEAALSASLMRSAAAIAGRGSVVRVEIVSQAPRRRTGVVAG